MERAGLVRKLAIIGGNGQLARAFRNLCPDAVFLDRGVIDLSEPGQVRRLSEYECDVVINAAAYTQVDNAEKEETLAHLVNAESPGRMAEHCAARGVAFIHFSTDYVFDGSGETPWKEEDAPNPLNAYGRSKLEGEKRIGAAGGRHLIFRTSWAFDAKGKNFPNTILGLAAQREELNVINDQYGAPTYVPHLAKAALAALDAALCRERFPSGIYHLCNAGVTTWHGLACAAVEEARKYGAALKVREIHPIPASAYPLPAKRPFNSRLNCDKIKNTLAITMPDWREGLKEYMRNKHENNGLPA